MVGVGESGNQDLKEHILICGWSPAAASALQGLARSHADTGTTVVLVNQEPSEAMIEVRARYPQLDVRHVQGPYHLETTLRRARCEAASSAIVVADTAAGPDADNRTIICTLAIENLSADVKTCAELVDRDNEPNLRRAGVDEVIVTGEHGGYFLSSGALAPGLSKAARRLITFGSGSEIRRVPVPPEFLNRTFGDLQEFVRPEGAMLLGIIREAEVVTVGDLFGSGQDWIDAFIRSAFSEAGEDVLDRDSDPIKVFVNPADEFVLEFKDSAILIGGSGGG